jgi:serine/threonine-protein kinase
MGTAEYMAPEQARSADRVDARADLYAVGVMLYEMLAGRRPVCGDEALLIATKVERGEVEPLVRVAPEVPRELAGFVHRAMAAQPELRFSTATEMRLQLERIAFAGQVGAAAGVPYGGAPRVPPLSPPGGTTVGVPDPGQAVAVSTSEGDPSTRTLRAPPLPSALVPPGYVAPAPFASGQRGPRRSRAPVTLVIVIPLLFGAAVVCILVGTGALAVPSPERNIGSTDVRPHDADRAPATMPASSPPPTVATAAPNDVPTLLPIRQTSALASPKPNPSGRSPAALPSVRDAAAPAPEVPFLYPSSLPAIPGVLALPSAFPTSLPGLIPGWTPRPSPPAAPTGSGAGY